MSLVFFALSDPTRRGIIERLSHQGHTAGELAKPYAMSPSAVSKHLKVLEDAGLVVRGRQSQWRPRHLDATPLAPAADWLETYRGFWDRSFQALGRNLLETDPAQTGFPKDADPSPPPGKRRPGE